jgi:hypothetical protein
MSRNLVRGVVFLTAIAVALPPPSLAQPKPVPIAEAGATEFNVEQLDAMLAPIALYPDELLTQTLMATTYPLQVVAASRWLEQDTNRDLRGDSLAKALERESWDPSVKSLVPFPQVIATMNDNLEWTQQLGYAVATQQAAVLDSIQRLRRQAKKAGSLKTTEQQRVVVQEDTVVIQQANPEPVYVPVYNPTEVYGEWPYPSSPPVYMPPPPAYYPAGYALGAGLAFAAGVAVVGGLWGWARPAWNTGTVAINAGRYNNINVNRPPVRSGTWRPPAGGGRWAPYSPARRTGRRAWKGETVARQCYRAGQRASTGECGQPAADLGSGGQPRPSSARGSTAAGRRTRRPAAGCQEPRRNATARRRSGPCTGGGPAPERRPAAGRRTKPRWRAARRGAASEYRARSISLCRTAAGGCLWQHRRRRPS